MRTAILLGLLVLAGCTSAVTMRNPSTGAVAQCGPYANTWETHYRESQCINDYKQQGYVRAGN